MHLEQPKFLGSRYIRQHFEGKPCPYCGQEMQCDQPTKRPTLDHLRPKSKGGNLHGNCLVVCSRCNHHKGSMSLHAFAAYLERKRDPRADRVRRVAAVLGGNPVAIFRRGSRASSR
jgi:5-methylcytosine-specific restriction endonuclease McrA